MPNPAFERTAASALRLLAVPSSLRSSAAAQRERWALPMVTLEHMRSLSVLFSRPSQPPVPHRFARAPRRALIRELSDVCSFSRAPRRVPAGRAGKVANTIVRQPPGHARPIRSALQARARQGVRCLRNVCALAMLEFPCLGSHRK